MQLAFKRGYYDDHFESVMAFGIMFRNLLNSLTGGFNFNGLNLVHGELVFGPEFNNVSFSSDPTEGVRFKQIKYSHPERWVFVDWQFTHPVWGGKYVTEADIYRKCQTMVGKKYDWLGIISQGIGVDDLENPNEYFCTESTSYIQGLNPYHLNPQDAYKQNIRINEQIKAKAN